MLLAALILQVTAQQQNWTLLGHIRDYGRHIQYFDHGKKIAVVDGRRLLVFGGADSPHEYDAPANVLNLGLRESRDGVDWWFIVDRTHHNDYYCLHLPGDNDPRRIFSSDVSIGNLVSIGYSPDRAEVMVNTMQGIWLWSRKTDSLRLVTGEPTHSPFFLLDHVRGGVPRWDSVTAFGGSVDEVLNIPKPIKIKIDPAWDYRSVPTWIWKYSPYLRRAFSQDGKVLDLKAHASSEFPWHDPDKPPKFVEVPFFAVAEAASTVVYGIWVDPRPNGGTGPPASWTNTLYVINGRTLMHVATITTPDPAATGIALSPDGRHLAAIVGKDVLVTDLPKIDN